MGHFSKDCPTGGGIACRNCGEEGHVSKECDKPRNPATVTCRNCDETGHFSRDCPLPRDYSKVKCQNCGESMQSKPLYSFVLFTDRIPVGHTKVRCKQPPAEDNDGFDNGGGVGGGDNSGGFGDTADRAVDTLAIAGGGDDWAPVPAAPMVTAGDW